MTEATLSRVRNKAQAIEQTIVRYFLAYPQAELERKSCFAMVLSRLPGHFEKSTIPVCMDSTDKGLRELWEKGLLVRARKPRIGESRSVLHYRPTPDLDRYFLNTSIGDGA